MSTPLPAALVQHYRHHWLLTHLLGQKLAQRLDPEGQKDWHQELCGRLRTQGPGRRLQIERRKNLSLREFRQVYLRLGIPVIMVGAARHWPCIQKWTPDWLAERYGDDPVALIDAAPGNLAEIDYQMRQTHLRELIREMDAQPLEKYSRFNRLLYDHPELRHDFDARWLRQRRNRLASGNTFQVFIGGQGSHTHLHAAAEHNLFTQVYGRKHWYLYPPSYDLVLQPPVNRAPYFHSPYDPDHPDLERFPAMAYLDHYECILEPGDIFFNPPSWWHHVTNLTGSIGVGYRWFAPEDAFRQDWAQALLTLLAINPPIWMAMKHRTDFAQIFSHMSQNKREPRV